jgi:hypothetical protein
MQAYSFSVTCDIGWIASHAQKIGLELLSRRPAAEMSMRTRIDPRSIAQVLE